MATLARRLHPLPRGKSERLAYRLYSTSKMTRALAQVARPCLRRLGHQAIVPPSASVLSAGRVPYASTGQHAQFGSSPSSSAAVQVPIEYTPSTKPPSARPIETRKTQLIRTYTSTLRTTPLILFFQHNNLTAVEWAAVRREVTKALAAVPATAPGEGLASQINLSVLRTNMFDVALKIVEFHNPEATAALSSTPRTLKGPLVHDLSEAAYKSIKSMSIPADSAYAQLEQLMVGPIAALFVPAVSPAHLAAALSILAPVPGKFPAPKKSKNPGYYEPTCQNALAKLLLVGGRIEGKVFDQAGVNWVGGIESGIDGLRAQLVEVLQSAGLGITSALEGGSKSLWLTLEGRKTQLDDQGKPEKADNEGHQG